MRVKILSVFTKNGVEVNLSVVEKLTKDSSIRYGIDEKRIRIDSECLFDPDIVKE